MPYGFYTRGPPEAPKAGPIGGTAMLPKPEQAPVQQAPEAVQQPPASAGPGMVGAANPTSQAKPSRPAPAPAAPTGMVPAAKPAEPPRPAGGLEAAYGGRPTDTATTTDQFHPERPAPAPQTIAPPALTQGLGDVAKAAGYIPGYDVRDYTTKPPSPDIGGNIGGNVGGPLGGGSMDALEAAYAAENAMIPFGEDVGTTGLEQAYRDVQAAPDIVPGSDAPMYSTEDPSLQDYTIEGQGAQDTQPDVTSGKVTVDPNTGEIIYKEKAKDSSTWTTTPGTVAKAYEATPYSGDLATDVTGGIGGQTDYATDLVKQGFDKTSEDALNALYDAQIGKVKAQGATKQNQLAGELAARGLGMSGDTFGGLADVGGATEATLSDVESERNKALVDERNARLGMATKYAEATGAQGLEGQKAGVAAGADKAKLMLDEAMQSQDQRSALVDQAQTFMANIGTMFQEGVMTGEDAKAAGIALQQILAKAASGATPQEIQAELYKALSTFPALVGA